MSKQAVIDFINAATQNPDYRAEIRRNVQNIASYAGSNGFVFTPREFAEVLRDKWVMMLDSAPHFCGCYVCYPPGETPDIETYNQTLPSRPGRGGRGSSKKSPRKSSKKPAKKPAKKSSKKSKK